MRTQHIVVSTAALMFACGSALGQNALGDGRALDANLHATQGRINPRASGIEDQIRFNNAVINGSAPGGMSFRGSTGYRAPDQFGARTGSDSLYSFQRDSWASGQAATGIRGSDALRYQFALTTGQRVPGFLATTPAGLAREGTVSTSANAAVTSLRSTSEFLSGQASRPALVGMRQDEWGAEYVVRASPLLGVTWMKTAESPLGAAAARPPAPGTIAPGTVAPGTTAPGSIVPGATPPAPGVDTTPTTKPETAPVRSGLSGMESTVRGVQGALDRPNALDTRVKGSSTAVRNEVQTRVVDKFREGFAEKPAQPDASPQAEVLTFEKQMELLHKRLRGETDPDAKDTKPATNPTTPTKPEKGTSSDKDPGTTLAGADASTDSKEQAERKKRDREQGLPGPQTAITPEVLRAMRKASETKLDRLVTPAPAVGADMADPDGYVAMMREGEQMLTKGQFFGAEERFVRALAAAPGDAMARVGRVHAQLGAGLYLSAATNLRSFIADHPEMTSARYVDRLMPTAERSQIIAAQLEAEEKKAESLLGRESALLLAYLGYQRADAATVKRGLDDFAKRTPEGEAGAPDRALLEVVRAAWQK